MMQCPLDDVQTKIGDQVESMTLTETEDEGCVRNMDELQDFADCAAMTRCTNEEDELLFRSIPLPSNNEELSPIQTSAGADDDVTNIALFQQQYELSINDAAAAQVNEQPVTLNHISAWNYKMYNQHVVESNANQVAAINALGGVTPCAVPCTGKRIGKRELAHLDKYKNAHNGAAERELDDLIYVDANSDDFIEEVADTTVEEDNESLTQPLSSAERTKNACGCSIGLTAAPISDVHSGLFDELQYKAKQCANPTYNCTLPCIEKSKFCAKHALYDGNGVYVACKYKYENGKRCTNARKKDDMSQYCVEHSLEYMHDHTNACAFQAVETNEYHLQHLVQHINIDQELLMKESIVTKEEDFIDVENLYCTPFIYNENVDSLENVVRSARNRRVINEFDGVRPSDEACILNTVRCGDDASDDDVSVDSDSNDPLKHAVIFTGQEVVQQTLNKSRRLLDLYLLELHNLQNMHKKRRQVYLQEIKKEREILCSIKDQPQETADEQKYYAELKALNSYHRHHGANSILYKKYKEKYARANGYVTKGPGFTICYFVDEDGIKCELRALPCTRYCSQHITQDKKQVLYRPCGGKSGNTVCKKPVIPFLSAADHCILHQQLPKEGTP